MKLFVTGDCRYAYFVPELINWEWKEPWVHDFRLSDDPSDAPVCFCGYWSPEKSCSPHARGENGSAVFFRV